MGSDASRGQYYWTVKHMQRQLVNNLFIFKKKFKLNTKYRQKLVIPVFHLDNAPSHTARPENALNAYKMNVNPGISYICILSLLKRFFFVFGTKLKVVKYLL